MFDIDNILANKEIFLENINDGGNREDILRIYTQAKGDSDTELSKPFSEIAEAMMAGKLVAVQQFSFTITIQEDNVI